MPAGRAGNRVKCRTGVGWAGVFGGTEVLQREAWKKGSAWLVGTGAC